MLLLGLRVFSTSLQQDSGFAGLFLCIFEPSLQRDRERSKQLLLPSLKYFCKYLQRASVSSALAGNNTALLPELPKSLWSHKSPRVGHRAS